VQKYFDDVEARDLAKSTVRKRRELLGPKLKAMVLLLRHSGLRLQDAACLERARVKGDKLFLYTQNTGTPVYCPLPPESEDLAACNSKAEIAHRVARCARIGVAELSDFDDRRRRINVSVDRSCVRVA